jgi:hypothetical protein
MSEGGRYRSYILVALPIGEANQLRQQKVNEQLSRTSEARSREAFSDLDNKTKQ